MSSIKIGLIGKGSIGTFLLKKINEENFLPNHKITALFDERKKSNSELQKLAHRYGCKAFSDMNLLLEENLDLIIECATIEVAKKYACNIIGGADLLLISIGALADTQFAEKLEATAATAGHKVYLPSGAIGGLDIIKAANLAGELVAVTLTSRKPARALTEEILSEEKTIFDGPAGQAIQEFPKNANVAIALSLAGLGMEKTKVKIIADPFSTKNMHLIEAEGGFGEMKLSITNNPSSDNPRTSYLTALSILSTVNSLENSIVIGS